ncbi:uncharacterized protein LACBIDRAFT_323305 [Laccaria bicolor S238N-H82]|uniref:Predicted protein n=1 Tax=Laccaria bicolor (strain S238N-H82 / ATCC MYA-4686) TaxID=486041 RepID=B0CZS9_LACBS|nr:uncharacterized protein LACBIDRAFT_323305 [Laccaria bicolor S238N-H82]EDR12206.1 predicted protein [Laccaria bicolor S238N-H82]|eukprot:XP_001876470.1 predicted protein [Laccaria bicolor S238N-H82]
MGDKSTSPAPSTAQPPGNQTITPTDDQQDFGHHKDRSPMKQDNVTRERRCNDNTETGQPHQNTLDKRLDNVVTTQDKNDATMTQDKKDATMTQDDNNVTTNQDDDHMAIRPSRRMVGFTRSSMRRGEGVSSATG